MLTNKLKKFANSVLSYIGGIPAKISDSSDDYSEVTDEYKSVLYKYKGEEECDEELALSYLLKERIMFANNVVVDTNRQEYTICLFVECNDVFMWGCSDAQSITTDEIKDLYKFYKKDAIWGAAAWCCIKRNMQPQEAVVIAMKKHGSWTKTMEKLEVNPDQYQSTYPKEVTCD